MGKVRGGWVSVTPDIVEAIGVHERRGEDGGAGETISAMWVGGANVDAIKEGEDTVEVPADEERGGRGREKRCDGG